MATSSPITPETNRNGDVGRVGPGELQRLQAVEAGQRVVGQDQVVAMPLEGLDELGLAVDPVDLGTQALLGQPRSDQVGVEVAVFQVQNLR